MLLLRNLSFALKRVNAIGIRCYEYPDIEDIINKNIIIYGAGMVGQDYYAQFSIYRNCNIIAWVDVLSQSYKFDYCEVYPVETIQKMNFDIVIIAVSNENLAIDISDALVQMGVDKNKIIWKSPVFTMNIRSD